MARLFARSNPSEANKFRSSIDCGEQVSVISDELAVSVTTKKQPIPEWLEVRNETAAKEPAAAAASTERRSWLSKRSLSKSANALILGSGARDLRAAETYFLIGLGSVGAQLKTVQSEYTYRCGLAAAALADLLLERKIDLETVSTPSAQFTESYVVILRDTTPSGILYVDRCTGDIMQHSEDQKTLQDWIIKLATMMDDGKLDIPTLPDSVARSILMREGKDKAAHTDTSAAGKKKVGLEKLLSDPKKHTKLLTELDSVLKDAEEHRVSPPLMSPSTAYALAIALSTPLQCTCKSLIESYHKFSSESEGVVWRLESYVKLQIVSALLKGLEIALHQFKTPVDYRSGLLKCSPGVDKTPLPSPKSPSMASVSGQAQGTANTDKSKDIQSLNLLAGNKLGIKSAVAMAITPPEISVPEPGNVEEDGEEEPAPAASGEHSGEESGSEPESVAASVASRASAASHAPSARGTGKSLPSSPAGGPKGTSSKALPSAMTLPEQVAKETPSSRLARFRQQLAGHSASSGAEGPDAGAGSHRRSLEDAQNTSSDSTAGSKPPSRANSTTASGSSGRKITIPPTTEAPLTSPHGRGLMPPGHAIASSAPVSPMTSRKASLTPLSPSNPPPMSPSREPPPPAQEPPADASGDANAQANPRDIMKRLRDLKARQAAASSH